MSKLTCNCGHVIRDQSDNLPFKGQILKDQDRGDFCENTSQAFVEYVSAIRSGNLDSWLEKWPWLRGATDRRVFSTLLDLFWLRYKVDVYECEACGRLMVQDRTDSQTFVPFTPEHDAKGRILSSQ